MKTIKLAFLVLSVLFISKINAQQKIKEKENEPKHEVSLDFLELFNNNKLEISYNYLLNKSNSIGTTVYVFPKNKEFRRVENYQENLGIDVNFKHFFSKHKTQGFYLEGFSKYSFGHLYPDNPNFVITSDTEYHTIDIGLGIGYKQLLSSEIYLDVNARLGKTLYNSNKTPYDFLANDNYYFSVSLGKRF